MGAGKGAFVFPADAIPTCAPAGAPGQPSIFRQVHRFDPARHLHRIEVCAAAADDRAASHRIPGRVGPFYLGLSHTASVAPKPFSPSVNEPYTAYNELGTATG